MSTIPRYLPPGKFLADITQRCLLGHYLLKPGKRLNLLVAGVVAKALEKYPVELIGLAVPSNHYHALVAGNSQEDLSAFMNFVAGNVAKEAGRLHGWKGRLWEGRYRCIPVTEEEAIQVARLKYLLSQGCKEGLVASPRQRPGVHCAKALMTGQGIPGVWVDRTALYNARRRKKDRENIRPIDFEEDVLVTFAPLPCWAHLAPEAYQQRIRNLVEEIEGETAAMHRRNGTQPLGRRAILARNPHHRPESLKKSFAPKVHAATTAAREAFLQGLRLFLLAYRAASERFRAGDLLVEFPDGCFRPHGPFVQPRGAPVAA